MNEIGITEYEIIFDEVSNIPYKLRPYTRFPGMGSDEPDVVSIYNIKNGLKSLIESLSSIVNAQLPISSKHVGSMSIETRTL